jgi:hypothetical protein
MDATQEDIKTETTVIRLSGRNTSCVVKSTELSFFLPGAAKHSRPKGLLNPISIAGGLDNPLAEVEYKRIQSNFILTTQGKITLKIFGEMATFPITLWVTGFGGCENL